MATKSKITKRRRFAPLVAECAKYGIRRTKAFELARTGQVSTFKLGRRTYVLLDSLENLPERQEASK